MNIQNIVMALALAGVIAWQSGAFARGAGITPQEAKTLQAENKIVLLDVREKDEVEQGVLAGALWIPLSGIQSGDPAIAARISQLDLSKEIIVYCRSGKRASVVAEKLVSQGFRVRNLGGFSDASAAGMKTQSLKVQ